MKKKATKKIISKNTKHQKSPSRPSKPTINNNHIWIFGKHSFYNSLQKQKRQFYQILISKNNEEEFQIFLNSNKTLKEKISHLIKIQDNKVISNTVDNTTSPHQGYALLASKLKTNSQLDLLTKLHNLNEKKHKLPTLLILDQITDPHNIGAIIRSAVAFGVEELILSEHNSISETSTTIRTSVGLIEDINITIVTNINNLIEKIKKLDYWVAGLAGEGEENIADLKNYENIALIVGSEGEGIRKLIKKNCDLLTKIVINEKCESLNASVATAIALYELRN
ncbi:MAG: 23S rRNA (guanosine(2251)-2'-O)-methyltransferase RlmB [Rickettsiales bacterium]|nr:23S rRNA (guanosine(2251)-2'-O)-methyltransferase RlmB [Rickettsiales bacterium]